MSKKIKILNLNKTISSDHKFSTILDNADEEITDWILDHGVTNWEELQGELEKRQADKIDVNKLVYICAKHKRYDENALEFMEYMKCALDKFNVAEEAQIKLIAMNIWPHKQAIKDELSQAKDFESLKYLIRQRERKEYYNFEKNSHASSLRGDVDGRSINSKTN